MSTSLMTTRRFAPLFWCQFFSAFNDNFLKNALVFLILFAPGIADREALSSLTAAVFIAPFFFLSGLGGEMADRFDKALWRNGSSLPRPWSPLSRLSASGSTPSRSCLPHC